jgi:hypothetical protein
VSFFSKIFSFKNKEKQQETTEGPLEVCPPVDIAGSAEADFESLLTEENFQGYTIERNVHVNRFDPSAHPSCLPVSYLFAKNGTPVLAVYVMQRNHYRAMIAIGAYRVLEEQQIPYIRFFKGFRNEKQYVLDRVRAALEERS